METAGQTGSTGAEPGTAVSPGETRLLFTPAMGVGDDCVDVCTSGSLDDAACLVVSLNETVDAVVDRWERHGGTRPDDLAVVSVGETTRSAAAATGSNGVVELTGTVKTATVSDAADLTGLGIKISQCLEAWEDRDEIVVCFDSLTSLLQYEDLKRVFQFVHVLTSQLRTTGARAHFHLTPTAHDDRTVATLRSLFDGVYERDGDGEWREV